MIDQKRDPPEHVHVVATAPDGEAVAAVRCGEEGRELLFLRKAADGKPVMGDLVQLTRPADPQAPPHHYDLHTLYKASDRSGRGDTVGHAGPARVSNDSYRAGWDAIFGKAPKTKPN